MKLTSAQIDRACGALLATAAGDALGAGYEFGPPLPPGAPVEMKGGGGFAWAPGEWTDDTSMAIPIARAAADGLDLRATATHDVIVRAWVDWARTAPDVGVQTSSVLRGVRGGGAAEALAASRDHHISHGRSGGNGSLMRTAPVAMAFLDDPEGLTEAATALSRLTHWERDAAEGCVLWCHLIRHAVLTGEIDPDEGRVAVGSGVRVGRIDQARQAMDGPEPLLDVFCARTATEAGGRDAMDPTEARTLLAKFSLSGDHVARPCRSLSPGERTRAALALLQARGTNTLVLDEPTNHLDLPAIEQLEQAVESFTGTVLLVTHDRRMCDGFRATRRLHVDGGRVTETTYC